MNVGPPNPRRPDVTSGHPVAGSESVLGTIAIVAILAVGALAVVAWCGAQLAGITFGSGSLPVGLATAGRAAHGLLTDPAHPSAAWPKAARGRLPGAVAYWACTGTVAAAYVGMAVALTRVWFRWAKRAGHPLGVAPHAGFARPKDIQPLLVNGPRPGRLTLGLQGRRLVAAEPQASLAVIGPTGSGKTVGFAIPALLEWTGPVIATSVKNDLLDGALQHRAGKGTVWVYDPTRSSGRDTACWSPLAACGTWAGAMRIAAWLCEAAQPRIDTVSDGDYWYTQARKGLAPYLYAAAVEGKTMRDVVRWIDVQEQDEIITILERHAGVGTAIDEMLASELGAERRAEIEPEVTAAEIAHVRQHLARLGGGARSWEQQELARWPLDQQAQLRERVATTIKRRLTAECSEQIMPSIRASGRLDPLIAVRALWDKEPRLRGSVFATIENVLAGYADPGVARASAACDIDLTTWLTGNNTIFVVAPAHEQARLRPVLTVLVQQAIRSAYELANANRGTLPQPCLVLLDEAGNIAPLRDLPGYASTARSHGITLVSIWQDLAQIKAIYGDRAQTVLNNHRAKLFGTGIADEATLEYVSRLVGDERRTEINVSGDLHGTRRSISEHTAYRRAAPVDLLRRIRTNEAVLVYGSLLPVHLRLRPRGTAVADPTPRRSLLRRTRPAR
jgi:type IV secretion system protein VirD4